MKEDEDLLQLVLRGLDEEGASSPAAWKSSRCPSGDADEHHQLETVRVNELPLINTCGLGLDK